MTGILEYSIIRYYVYNDDSISLPNIRANAIQGAPKTWKVSWGTCYANYALGGIRWLEALEDHPLRTQNPSEAGFFVVPIPVGATLIWGQNKTCLKDAFETVFDGTLFQ